MKSSQVFGTENPFSARSSLLYISPVLSKKIGAKIDKSAVKVLPIFELIASTGNIPERDMYNTYNMGVGMSVVVPACEVEKALEILRRHGEDAYVIGEIVKGDEGVVLL